MILSKEIVPTFAPARNNNSSVIEGRIVSCAMLDQKDIEYMNFARSECDKLTSILLQKIVPALGGYENELACDIARHIEQIRTFSGNFCWRHRGLEQSHGEVYAGGRR